MRHSRRGKGTGDRVRRKLFNFAAAVSLAVCIAVAGLWWRASWNGGIVVTRYSPNSARAIRSGTPGHEGQLEYSSLHDPTGIVIPFLAGPPQIIPATFARDMHINGRSLWIPGITLWWGNLPPGLVTPIHADDPAGPFGFFVLWADLASLIVLSLILPMIWIIALFVSRRLNHRRTLLCRCRQCGYDLTGNASGVCPECGTPIPGKAEATA